jgi:hypothetical protein
MQVFSIYFWKDLKYNIRDFFFPRQKWLLRNVSRHWCDKVDLIRIVLFEILIHFVEEEMDSVSWDWQEEVELGYTSQEHADRVKTTAAELRSVYNYIKNERPNLEKQMNESVFFTKTLNCAHSDYLEYISLDKKIEEFDEHAMQVILKNRNHLWT